MCEGDSSEEAGLQPTEAEDEKGQVCLTCLHHSSVLPGFLRRLAIATYNTNSKPSQSNGYAMLLLQYNYERSEFSISFALAEWV